MYDEGIHDNIHSRSVFHSIHGCMVKETWLPVQAVQIRRHFSNISRHWIHNSSLEQLVKLFLAFFLFHFQQGSNKTWRKEFKCCMYCRPYAKPTANNNLSVLEACILVYQFSHIVCMRTQSNRNAKFSNPPTHTHTHIYIYIYIYIYAYIHTYCNGGWSYR